MPDPVRAYMEPRFGVDFSQVRVHTGSDALQMNQAVGAQAFTHGSDIYFGAGHSPTNLELTAHELTHVVQQTGGAALTQDTSSVQRQQQECRKYDSFTRAHSPEPPSTPPATTPRHGEPPLRSRQSTELGSLAGSQQAAIGWPEYSSRLPDDGRQAGPRAPASAGQRLLAHEVTHTMQQQDRPTRHGPHGAVLQMQRLIGNRAVQAALQRKSASGVIRPRPTTVGARAQEAD